MLSQRLSSPTSGRSDSDKESSTSRRSGRSGSGGATTVTSGGKKANSASSAGGGTCPDLRRLQNRTAQRAFRERKQAYIAQLEDTVKRLEQELEKMSDERRKEQALWEQERWSWRRRLGQLLQTPSSPPPPPTTATTTASNLGVSELRFNSTTPVSGGSAGVCLPPLPLDGLAVKAFGLEKLAQHSANNLGGVRPLLLESLSNSLNSCPITGSTAAAGGGGGGGVGGIGGVERSLERSSTEDVSSPTSLSSSWSIIDKDPLTTTTASSTTIIADKDEPLSSCSTKWPFSFNHCPKRLSTPTSTEMMHFAESPSNKRFCPLGALASFACALGKRATSSTMIADTALTSEEKKE